MTEEPWLRGPVEGVIAELQPMVHELLFAKEELPEILAPLNDEDVWATPGGIASIGYHIRHCSGSTRRMLTYAANRQLSDDQFEQLKAERIPDPTLGKQELLDIAFNAIDQAIAFASNLKAAELDEPRRVGRKQLPSNVRGLLYEIAVHTSRHVGQVATTARLLAKP